MKEIKLMIDGKEVALTKEQIKALGIDVDDGCVCDRANDGSFYFVSDECNVEKMVDRHSVFSSAKYECGNYYRDESYAEQVALHQKLNNLLRRYSEQHGGDKEWSKRDTHYRLVFDCLLNKVTVTYCYDMKSFEVVYFRNQTIAEKAIEEVVKPFMEEHPDFVW